MCFVKEKSTILSFSVSLDGKFFATYCSKWYVWVFDLFTGKKLIELDESIEATKENQKSIEAGALLLL